MITTWWTRRKENNMWKNKHANVNYNIHFSCSEVSAAYPKPSFGRAHTYINKNTTVEKEEKGVSSFVISTQKQTRRREKKEINQAHRMYKKKERFGFSYFRQCYLSHSAYDMVEEKNDQENEPIWNNNAHTLIYDYWSNNRLFTGKKQDGGG